MARMVCVWLPNWPLQRLRHERPELRDRPVVLFSNTGNRGPRVTATDATVGLTIGMPLAEAEALLAGQPGIAAHIERHDPAADVAALRELARSCNAFSPLFGIEEAESPECVLLDVTGCEHLFGSEHNLVNTITNDFQQRDFQVRAALAPTIGAAWAMAHHRSPTPCRSVNCQGDLNRSGHKGLSYETLAPLPVTALRLPPKIIETLHELGLRRIGQLRALPRETLPSRFGAELLKRLDQAFGDAPELLVPERPLEPVATTWVTDEPLTDRESLKFVVGQLLDELLGRLKPRREGARQLFCQIKGTAARPIEFVLNLVSPCDVAKHLLELLGLQIDRTDLPEGISFVRLEATSIASLATRQRDLFGFETNTDTHREVSSLLDRLSNRLGASAVVRAMPLPDPQPELSVTHDSVARECRVSAPISIASVQIPRRPTIQSGADTPHSKELRPIRPLRLFAPPQRIEATDAGPEGAPMNFRWDHREHRVIRSWGPERIETGWWREQSICRDYFRVETQTGQHFWLFRCFDQAAWFLHGAFD
ncbi:MAG: DNA polymerase Y family protein [Planctomycetes bacterium]|nr:DNA polymerase Y family protein [Planctomycetota bacterium]